MTSDFTDVAQHLPAELCLDYFPLVLLAISPPRSQAVTAVCTVVEWCYCIKHRSGGGFSLEQSHVVHSADKVDGHGGKHMSFVTAEPGMLSAAAGNLAGIGESMQAGTSAAAGPTTAVVPPAVDPVSAFTAAQFVRHAEMFQAIGAQAAAIHEHMAATLASNADAYASSEAANVTDLG